MRKHDSRLTVCVCTRDRPEHLRCSVQALLHDLPSTVTIVVVDQSASIDHWLRAVAEVEGRVEVIQDAGRGLSRARNLAWRSTTSAWVAFVDDDCEVLAGWSAALLEVLDEHPEAAFVTGDVEGSDAAHVGGIEITTFAVPTTVVHRGRWTRPWAIGFGVCMAVQRSWLERLGGWDERLGPGVPDAPAADDMDFNHRLLRAGGVTVASHRMRAIHHQWRDARAISELQFGYAMAWSVFAMKTLRGGHIASAIWLWTWGPYDAAKMLASAARRRSRLRARIAWAQARGHTLGTIHGLTRRLR